MSRMPLSELTPRSQSHQSVTATEFARKITVVAICVALCLAAMIFNWVLDFACDVLHYGGHRKDWAWLVSDTSMAIRWFHKQAPTAPIIVVGHSFGSVIASHAIGSMSALEPCLRQIVLVTLGSPLNYLSRAFPELVKGARELSKVIGMGVRWINLWRRHDFVGKALSIEANGAVQYCVGKGGHAGYWSDGAVWRAVAREALGQKVGGGEAQSPSPLESCIVERWLAVLVFALITFLALCGAVIWLVAP